MPFSIPWTDAPRDVLLAREDFVRPDWTADVHGAEAALAFLTPGPD
jgi:hypothetical protein